MGCVARCVPDSLCVVGLCQNQSRVVCGLWIINICLKAICTCMPLVSGNCEAHLDVQVLLGSFTNSVPRPL